MSGWCVPVGLLRRGALPKTIRAVPSCAGLGGRWPELLRGRREGRAAPVTVTVTVTWFLAMSMSIFTCSTPTQHTMEGKRLIMHIDRIRFAIVSRQQCQ